MPLDLCCKKIKVVFQGETLSWQRVPKGSSSWEKTIPIKVLLDLAYEQQDHATIKISGMPYSFIRKAY